MIQHWNWKDKVILATQNSSLKKLFIYFRVHQGITEYISNQEINVNITSRYTLLKIVYNNKNR